MSILVICTGCGTKLSAPDTGAGQHVRCPKLQCVAIVPVPTVIPAEVVDASPSVPKPKPKPVVAKRPREDDGDDEQAERPTQRQSRHDDDEDDAPRKKRKRKKSGGGLGAGAIVAIVLGGLLVLGGVGIGIYALSKKKEGNSDLVNNLSGDQSKNLDQGKNPSDVLSSVRVKKTPPPKGWVEYTSKYDNFKAYFPREPKVTIEVKRGSNQPAQKVNGQMRVSPLDSSSFYSAHVLLDMGRGQEWAPLGIAIHVAEYKSEADWNQQRQVSDLFNPNVAKLLNRDGEARKASLLGMEAQELKSSHRTIRQLFVGLKHYAVTIEYLTGLDINPKDYLEDENAFFDNFELLK